MLKNFYYLLILFLLFFSLEKISAQTYPSKNSPFQNGSNIPSISTHQVICMPYNECGIWAGCALITSDQKKLLGGTDQRLCEGAAFRLKYNGNSFLRTVTIPANPPAPKNPITYLQQNFCAEILPFNLPPPPHTCPKACEGIPTCSGGTIPINQI